MEVHFYVLFPCANGPQSLVEVVTKSTDGFVDSNENMIRRRYLLAKLITMAYFIYIMGAVSIRKTVLPGMAIPMLKIRRPNGRLIFNMEITIRR